MKKAPKNQKIQKKTKTKKRKIDDQELLTVIDNISKKLAYKFKFGYHEIQDMKQQISVFAIEGLKNYDHKRPLENFLWTHVRNRLFNYKRDNYQRPNVPCYTCPLYNKADGSCNKFSNKQDCELYSSWFSRNNNKKNLMHLTTIDDVKSYGNIFLGYETNIDNKEILKILDENLIGDYRILYLKFMGGSKLSKADTEKLISKIKEILCLKNEDN